MKRLTKHLLAVPDLCQISVTLLRLLLHSSCSSFEDPNLMGRQMAAFSLRPVLFTRSATTPAAWRYSPRFAALSQFDARRVIPLIHRRFRMSNSIQIQNRRRPKVTTSRALPHPPDTPSARFVCVQKDPSPKCWGLFYAAFNLILTAGAGAGFTTLSVTTKQASNSSTGQGGGKVTLGQFSAPIFLRLTLHRRRLGIFHLHPIR
jgi:hypothetical protein